MAWGPVMYASHILNLCICRPMRSRVYHSMHLMVGGQDIGKEILGCWHDAGECIPATPKIEQRAALRFSKIMQNTGVGKQLAAAT